ncbi:hypothetical protein G9F32_04530 [Acinetobacter sp. 194]|uniref:hypothetical protein n=1 Tax=Acinetobacter shaoyimingii TaxID=2715164 RepID=UPI0014094DE4|nr:hypothetical protein [Acinetobacter shaoyimingii]NHB57300.1 hypothetical protein [Acinetobacter shaoyimingii]
MDLDVEKIQIQNHQQTAQKLLELSPTLKQIFQDQWFYVWSLTPDNLFVVHEEQQKITIADGLVQVNIAEENPHLIEFSTPHPNISVQKIADFVFNDIHFFLNSSNTVDALFLQSKVQIFRQIIVESVFEWVDGENRVEQYLYNLTEQEAECIDQLMIEAGYYNVSYLKNYAGLGQAIPLHVEVNIKHLCLINSIIGESFLAIQKVISAYEHFCLSAKAFIPAYIYRIMQITMPERYCLADLLQHQQDYDLLRHHAQENPHLLGFARRIKRGYWQYQDIFSKDIFLERDHEYWDDQFGLNNSHEKSERTLNYPICYLKRTVNWLFRQDQIVNDWISQHIDDANVRVTMTALSFLHTTPYPPHVILATLKYFKSSSARLFVQECAKFALRNDWIKHTHVKTHDPFICNQSKAVSDDQEGCQDIPANVLYVEEWLQIFHKQVALDSKIAKQVFKHINRVIQAFIQYLNDIVQNIPADLIQFIEPETQQSPYFFHSLKKHQLEVQDFRSLFKHQHRYLNQNMGIFESYVADYLIDLFQRQPTIAKNVTWTGLYQKAVKWHEQVYLEDTLNQLRRRVNVDDWPSVTHQKPIQYDAWIFSELNSLKQIINESLVYKHCLALSYTELIVDGGYAAFHMASLDDKHLHLTLGCYLKNKQLHFDQLRFANNEKASEEIEEIAQKFIQSLNQSLNA